MTQRSDHTQARYKTPPQDVVDLVDAEPTPIASVSPDSRNLLHLHYTALPPMELLAEPFERLAGLRINPRLSAYRRLYDFTHIEIQPLEGGPNRTIGLPPDCRRIAAVAWSPDGAKIAFSGVREDQVLLWVCDLASGEVWRILDRPLNDTMASSFRWMSGSDRLLVTLIPEGRPAPPERPRVPTGPVVQETAERVAQNRTYQDLLASAYDEALFEHYTTSQAAVVDLEGVVTPIGRPAMIRRLTPSPDGRLILAYTVRRPFSYDVPYYYFAHDVEVWNLDGEVVTTVASLPVADDVPIEGVPRGPRRVAWQPLKPATLIWVEALDEGDPNKKVDHRDRVRRHAAPFEGEPAEVLRTAERLSRVHWLDVEDRVLLSEYDRDRRWLTTHLHDLASDSEPSVIFDRSVHDVYNDPGSPLTTTLPDNTHVVPTDDDWILLAGNGATPQGYRPFVDRFNLATGATERLYEATAEVFGRLVGLGPERDGGPSLVVRQESVTSPPNFYLVEPDGAQVQLTRYPDPHPQLTGIDKRLLTYERDDGVPLSGTLYLPPGYQEGTRLPLVVWAYPVEFTDKQTAGQVRAAPNTFTRLNGTSPLMFLTQGYAVLYDATMPIVGDPETMNDTFVEQIQSSAKAAVDTVVGLGVADPERVAVAGHSYGAFMTVNLLAHTDLFRAGIARSGAYNRSLTPFGFQTERRTLWEARDIYVALSPYFYADQIKAPLLLIHGEDDDNAGTYPLQSKRLYHALKGLGGSARLVLLPHESHGYRARESILHVLAECFEWLERHLSP